MTQSAVGALMEKARRASSNFSRVRSNMTAIVSNPILRSAVAIAWASFCGWSVGLCYDAPNYRSRGRCVAPGQPTSHGRPRAGAATLDIGIDAADSALRGAGGITGSGKSILALPEAKRLSDKQHLRFVAKQPCLVCGREPCDPHHLRFAQSRGLGQKVSDEFTMPLCRAHHLELHRAGKETDW